MNTFEKAFKDKKDIDQGGQSQPMSIHICSQEQYMGISHSSGMLEIWQIMHMDTDLPKPYRIFNMFADSDFLFYYDDNSLRIVALYGIKAPNYEITKSWDTQLIVQNIDKEEPYFR